MNQDDIRDHIRHAARDESPAGRGIFVGRRRIEQTGFGEPILHGHTRFCEPIQSHPNNLGFGASPSQGKLADPDPQVVAAAAEFVGLTGSPQAVPLLIPLLRHPSEFVREAALLGLAEAGGREIARPAMPALKDESVAVRAAAVRAVAAAGDPTSSTVLIRRVEQEPDEGVQAELLRAIGRLGAREALEVLARYAEPGGMMHRRSATVRAAAVDGLRNMVRPEARGLLELYSKDKEPAVRKAAEAGLK